MQLDYNTRHNILYVKWADEVSVESPYFLETIIKLFDTIREKNITKLIVDSGKPAGGVLTEEVINYFTKIIPGNSLQYIALLESPDYFWDQNLLQVLNLLIHSYQLNVQVKVVKTKAAAEDWLVNILAETAR